MTAPASFKQSDITRAVAGAVKGGLRVGRVMIDPRGNITIEAATPGTKKSAATSWDDVLP